MTGINLLVVIISTIIIITDQTIVRLPYQLDGDIISLEGGDSINFELTFIDPNARQSTLEIKTEKWVHDCCLKIKTQSGLSIYLKTINNYVYPKVTAYLRLRTSLLSINLNQAAGLVMKNMMKTDTFSIKLSQASRAQVKVEIISNLHVSISGSAKLIMNGFVNGAANINVRQAARLNARSCLINVVYVDVSGAGVAYVNGEQYMRIITSQAGQVYSKDSIRIMPHQEHLTNQ